LNIIEYYIAHVCGHIIFDSEFVYMLLMVDLFKV